MLSSRSSEAGLGVDKLESDEAGAPLMRPAQGNSDQNAPRERNASVSAGTSLPAEAAASETGEGGGAEEKLLSGGAKAGGSTGSCSDAPASTGEFGRSLLSATAAANAMHTGGFGEGGEPRGGQGGNLGRRGRRSSPGTVGRLEETLPFYLHVSGWLDASAHAAVMAFMTLPCRWSFVLRRLWATFAAVALG